MYRYTDVAMNPPNTLTSTLKHPHPDMLCEFRFRFRLTVKARVRTHACRRTHTHTHTHKHVGGVVIWWCGDMAAGDMVAW